MTECVTDQAATESNGTISSVSMNYAVKTVRIYTTWKCLPASISQTFLGIRFILASTVPNSRLYIFIFFILLYVPFYGYTTAFETIVVLSYVTCVLSYIILLSCFYIRRAFNFTYLLVHRFLHKFVSKKWRSDVYKFFGCSSFEQFQIFCVITSKNIFASHNSEK